MNEQSTQSTDASSSGAPTDSANPGQSTAPPPAPEQAKPSPAVHPLPKKPRRTNKELRLHARYERLAKQAQGVQDPIVQADLATLRRDKAAFDRASSDPLDIRVVAMRQAYLRRDALGLLNLVLAKLVRCLTATDVGRDFVRKVKGPDPASTARNIVSGITPVVLGHNRPVLEELVQVLADYEHIEGEYVQLRTKANAATTGLAQATQCLRLSMGVLDLALRRHAKVVARAKVPATVKAPWVARPMRRPGRPLKHAA